MLGYGVSFRLQYGFCFVLQNCGVTTFVKMAILEAMWSVIRVPAMVFSGVGRICATFGMVVRVTSAAVSVVFIPCTFAVSLVTTTMRACESARKWAISKANKLMKMLIVLSMAILVVVVTCLCYVKFHIKYER